MLPPSEVPPEVPPARAREILAGDEFQPPDQSPLERALEWVSEQLGDLLGTLGGGGAGSVVGWVLLGLFVAALVVFVLRLGRGVQRDPSVHPDLVEVETSRPPEAWERDAADHAAAGRWKDALRCRFRALVAELIAGGVLRDLPGRTSGEYRAELARRAPAGAGAFAGASELFDRAWYGDLPTGPAEDERFQALAADVLEATASARRRETPELEPA